MNRPLLQLAGAIWPGVNALVSSVSIQGSENSLGQGSGTHACLLSPWLPCGSDSLEMTSE